MREIEPVGPVPPPTLTEVRTVVRPNPDFEKWVSYYAQIVCAASHNSVSGIDPRAIDPCGGHRWEARQIAYARLAEEHSLDGSGSSEDLGDGSV